jgi:hypothetical protein
LSGRGKIFAQGNLLNARNLLHRREIQIFNLLKTAATIAAAAALLTGCAASGPQFRTVQLSPVAANSGRVFFYRVYESFGAGMRPDIHACGKKVGESIPGGVFFVELPVGECEIMIPSILYPGERKLTVNISNQKAVYVRTFMGASSFGGRTNVELVPEETALNAIGSLSVTNTPSK